MHMPDKANRPSAYNLALIPYAKRIQLMRECYELSLHTHCDELDCSKSFARQRTSKTFDEILKMTCRPKKGTFICWAFIDRNASGKICFDEDYIDAGVSVGSGVEYFIFMQVPLDKLEYLVKKYEIPVLQ